ncbi:hypothetical protein CAPTEDRAFT_205392 [Capitella teleta]|uniref:Uncharacterized protein n=1 Tax=Capitella teleta TaxID=283909 RepID=R7TM40_CAPTE|nr:hypothetical protein CAPTEDRAFT_205392 [Capitella teleta]|eukprot:ELT94888.1 hypothetical protein CAPTEDRAFT_205392 [Capitella teleta]
MVDAPPKACHCTCKLGSDDQGCLTKSDDKVSDRLLQNCTGKCGMSSKWMFLPDGHRGLGVHNVPHEGRWLVSHARSAHLSSRSMFPAIMTYSHFVDNPSWPGTTFKDPPLMCPVPQPRWLLHVFTRDVLQCLEEYKETTQNLKAGGKDCREKINITNTMTDSATDGQDVKPFAESAQLPPPPLGHDRQHLPEYS